MRLAHTAKIRKKSNFFKEKAAINSASSDALAGEVHCLALLDGSDAEGRQVGPQFVGQFRIIQITLNHDHLGSVIEGKTHLLDGTERSGSGGEQVINILTYGTTIPFEHPLNI